MSTSKQNNFLFTVVIPTYNPNHYLSELLKSIENNECINEIEIIISDDQSTIDIFKMLTSFENLNIKIIHNKEHFGGSSIGRQNGLDEANGTWVTFADQDDIFVTNIFDKLKHAIDTNHYKNFIITNFYEIDNDYRILTNYVRTENFTHGKFYEKTFLKQNNIYFEKVKTCEDLIFSTKIKCAMIKNNISANYYNEYTYFWRKNDDSLSEGVEYFFKAFPEYITGTLGKYLEEYKTIDNETIKAQFDLMIIDNIINLYFYYQYMEFPLYRLPHIPKQYNELTEKYIIEYLQLASISLEQLINTILYEFLNEYAQIRTDFFHMLPFIESETFEQWILRMINI